MLNEREMKLARELAIKITHNNNLSDDEVIEVAREFVSNLKRVVTDVWNHIKEIFNDVINFIYEAETKKEHAYNWHVPLNTTRLSQVRIPNIHIPNIRSGL